MRQEDIKNKLKTREEIKKLSEELKAAGKTIATVNGSFDLLHVGHLDILEQASKQADVLIVGLNSDKSVKIYKSPNRPIIPEEYRAFSLASLAYVDYVTLFDEPDCLAFVESVKPHVHVNGAEYGINCIEAPIVKKNGGKLHLVERTIPFSTSNIISKIKSLEK